MSEFFIVSNQLYSLESNASSRSKHIKEVKYKTSKHKFLKCNKKIRNCKCVYYLRNICVQLQDMRNFELKLKNFASQFGSRPMMKV